MDAVMPGLAAAQDVHPMLVHFPIALWAAGLLFWVLGLRHREELWRAGRWLLYLGALSAVAAVASGLWAADRIGHDTPGHDLVHVHRNFMIAATALGAATAALAWMGRTRTDGWTRAGLLAGLVLTVAVCALGADRGALLVYGHGIGMGNEQREQPVRESSAPDAGAAGEAEGPASAEAEPRHDHTGHTH